MKTRDELEQERNRTEEKTERSFIGIGGALFIILGGGAIWLLVTIFRPADKPPAPIPASSAPVMTDSLQCDRLVEISRREGLVKGERRGNRIAVDAKRWAALEKDKRLDLVQYVACAAFAGRSLDSLDDGEMVEVVDAATRRTLARAGRRGAAVFKQGLDDQSAASGGTSTP